jgi:hypothetical protein
MPSCPSCRGQYEDSDVFCRKCGAQLKHSLATENNLDSEIPRIEINVGVARLCKQIDQFFHVVPKLEIRLSAMSGTLSNAADTERAISIWERQIDSEFEPYRDNPLIESLRAEAQKALHDWISCRVAESRRGSPL